MIKRLESVTSTNDYIKDNAAVLLNGDCVFTTNQTEGKGRRGRSWACDGKGLAMSVYLADEIRPERIPIIAAVGVRRALSAACAKDCSVKWPNDILLDGKKLAGILCEAAHPGSAVGIGVNLAQSDTDFKALGLPYAGSCFSLTGRIPSADRLSADITMEIINVLSMPWDDIIDEFSDNCITVGKEVKIITASDEFVADAVGIADDGELIIAVGGEEKRVMSGEVSVRGIYGYN